MMKQLKHIALIGALSGIASAQTSTPSEIVEATIDSVTTLHGEMENVLTGIGLVTGLRGQGSGGRVDRRALANFIRRNEINILEGDISSGNIALVSVMARLPAFAKEGMRIPVRVAAITDAASLEGGMLLATELKFADGQQSVTYVRASGTVSTGGFNAATSNASVTRNNPTTGEIARGGDVVQSIDTPLLSEEGHLELVLINPHLETAGNIAKRINQVLDGTGPKAEVVDPSMVRVRMPEEMQTKLDTLKVLAAVRRERVPVHNPVNVQIDTNSLTIIAGRDVRVSPCVISVGDLTISVVEDEFISQPLPSIRGQGTTERVTRSQIDVSQIDAEPETFVSEGVTANELLNTLRASSQLTQLQMIEVFKRLDSGGYLHAPLVIR